MSPNDGIYKLTKVGRSVARRITAESRDPILDFLYENKRGSCTFGELEVAAGLQSWELRTKLNSYISKRLIRKIGD
jgi:hypothetical protein